MCGGDLQSVRPTETYGIKYENLRNLLKHCSYSSLLPNVIDAEGQHM